jgi:hypothetical protein
MKLVLNVVNLKWRKEMTNEVKLLKRRIVMLEQQVLNINNIIQNEVADSIQKIVNIINEQDHCCSCSKPQAE